MMVVQINNTHELLTPLILISKAFLQNILNVLYNRGINDRSFVINELRNALLYKKCPTSIKKMVVDRLLVLYFDSYCMRTREIIIEILRNTRNIQIDRYTHQICDDITCENKEIRKVGVKFLKRLKCVVNDENVLLCTRKVDRKAYLSILKNNISIANQVYRDEVVKGALPNFTVKEHVKIAKSNFYVQSLLIRKIKQEGDSELVRQLKERIPVLSDEVDSAIKRMRKSR